MIEIAASQGRFGALLSGASDALYDKILLEKDGLVLAPTVGSIVPNWLLLIPRFKALNFSDWSSANAVSPIEAIDGLLGEAGLSRGDYLWFEHGAREPGSVMGCGADYAHIHVLYFPEFSFADFADAAMAQSNLLWTECDSDECYKLIDPAKSYLAAGHGNSAVFSQNVESTGSQFFRRVVAGLSKRPRDWDYRSSNYVENVRKTIANWQSLVSVANAGA